MPGSRSIQRPCVSSMSSRDGVKTSKTSRPPGRSSSRAARERLEPLVVVAQVEIRAERTRHERDALVDGRSAQVAEPQVEPLRDAGLPCALAADRQHPGRRVDADHVRARERGRDRDPPGSDAELHDLAARRERLVDVEGDVLDDARAPRVVEPRDRVVRSAQGACAPRRRTRATRRSNGSRSNQP